MSIKLLIPGTREPAAPYSAAVRGATSAKDAPAPDDLLEPVHVLHAFSLSPMARDRAGEPQAVDVEDNDILELEIEGGFTLWTSVASYRDRLAELKPEALTNGAVRVDTLPGASIEQRGVRDWLSTALRVLRLEPDQISIEAVTLAGERIGAWAATKLLLHLIEKRLKPGPGLYSLADGSLARGFEPDQIRSVTDLPEGKPILVFIHGTASSTVGSFGALHAPEARPQWEGLRRHFGEHIYAFEHRTLSESPIENAIQLAERLPRGARLHLVSHSRGGLVGDLLCLTGVSSDQLNRYGRDDPALAEADAQDKKDLKALSDLLTDKRFEVVRFLRVASPARGTLLASENIDTFLSILTHLIGLIPGLAGNPIYHVLKRVTLEVAKNRCQPEMIPGIEAMIPSSPLVALLNTVVRPVASNLGIVAGDIEGSGLFKRLGVFLTDNLLYERRDNDLVVNTDSMFGGLRRLKSGHYVFDQGADVSHFNYFRNERTRVALVRWLAAPLNETPAEFRPIEAEGRPPVVMQRAARAGAQPVLILIPDVMGSKLSANGRAIWPEYLPLAEGRFTDLEINSAEVQPGSPIDDYLELQEYLGNTHDVVAFAYDWRKSIGVAAQELAKLVEARLQATALPVRFLAHGAGGLVVRAMIAQHPKLWDRICERPGGRLVMLGTPNQGSHAIAETLLGVGVTIKQLALLDSVHDQQQILEVLARFPGVLELLPRNGEQWFTQNAWRDFRRASRDRAALPAAEDLRAAQGVVGALPDEIPHADKVLYIAGCAPLTMCGAKVENGRLALNATTLGDGKITHESGRLPGVASWYIEAEHGELAHAEQSLPAIVELLETGTTRRLATSPPALARGGPTAFRYVPPPVLFPDARDFGAALIGRRLESRGKKTRAPIKVSVIHGDLRFASHPVMVGHYLGDTIAGAEAHLDRRLGGALSRRYQLGLYPGDLGSNTVALCEPTPAQKKLGLPRGAIVLGLGKMGELSAAVLAEAVRKGALEYLLQLTNAAAGEEPPYAAPIQKTSAEIGLTTLLIGCNSASSMAVEDCVGALVRGVARANQEIEQVFGGTARGASGRAAQSIRIADMEIIELFVDTAVQATYAIAGMAKTLSSELNANIQAEPVLRQGQGGRQRLNQIANRDYWRRVVVTQVTSTSEGGNRRGALRFLAMSDRARAEITVQDRQPELIERLIGSSIRDTRFNRDHAKTLFELLVPNELKDSLTQQSWLVLVVDAETANYPWELLVDGDEPLCARIGMVRQLETSSYRIQIRASTVKSAYVLGDPLTGPGIPPLPGAREEARLVADLLKRNQWNVNHNEERPSALDVLNRLFDRPYRILHLAGHGYFEQAGAADGKGRSGMLLEDGVYLTAVEIAKMRQVPDLVFLNCCHLGEIGAEAPPRGSATAYNKLAASISRELIEMGVRAVVAAGWAVRDDAAKAFARTFYEEMLHGRSFGRALREARNKVAEDFRDCNTWGAYQAYGDPDFKLDPQRDPEKASNGPEFVAPQELIQELMFIRRNVKAALDPGDREADKAREDTLKRIENMLAKCPPGWRNRGDVLAALGDAYGELLAFENAVDCYQRALATEDAASISMKVAEQLANLEVRWGRRTGSPEQIERAIDRLDALLKLGETAERLSLLGSAWKRLAQLSEGAKVEAALKRSAECYKRANSRSATPDSVDPYPLLNWLTCEVLLRQPPADLEIWLARCESAAAGRYAQSRAFADAGAPHDAALLRAFLKGQIAEMEEEIVRGYEGARDEANATPREFGSVLDQLDFMAGILDKLGGTRRADVAALKRIHARLKGEKVEPPNPPEPSKPRAAAETPRGRKNTSKRRTRVKRAAR